MIVYAISGSPRKKWNCAQLMEEFSNGVKEVIPDAEVRTVYLYDYKYTGCRSCFGCKLKKGIPLQCTVKDDIFELLKEVRNSDGIILASPIYYFDLSAQMRGFLERLLYPGASPKNIPTAFIYAMNATEDVCDKLFGKHLDDIETFVESTFHVKPVRISSYDTYQRAPEELYRPSHMNMQAKKERHDTQFPLDLQAAHEEGRKFAQTILKQ